MHVHGANLTVCSIDTGGVAAAWNQQNPLCLDPIENARDFRFRVFMLTSMCFFPCARDLPQMTLVDERMHALLLMSMTLPDHLAPSRSSALNPLNPKLSRREAALKRILNRSRIEKAEHIRV